MDETIEYLGERFPDLTEGDLKDLYAVGIRFCQPAIPHGNRLTDVVEATESTEAADESTDAPEAAEDADPVAAGVAEPATAGVTEETGSSSTAAA